MWLANCGLIQIIYPSYSVAQNSIFYFKFFFVFLNRLIMSVTPVQTKKPNFLDYRHERKIDHMNFSQWVIDFIEKMNNNNTHPKKWKKIKLLFGDK